MRHARFAGGLPAPVRWVVAHLVAFVEGLAFWAAATFPFVHAATYLLYVRDAVSGTEVVALLALNAVAIVVGHQYNRSSE